VPVLLVLARVAQLEVVFLGVAGIGSQGITRVLGVKVQSFARVDLFREGKAVGVSLVSEGTR